MDASIWNAIGLSPYVIAIGTVIVWVINKLPALLDYQKSKKLETIENINKALSLSNSSDEKKVLKEIKRRHVFSNAIGFDAPSTIRDKLAKVILDSDDKYNYKSFIPISLFIKYDPVAKDIFIDINLYEWFFLGLMWVIYWALGISLIGLLIGSIFFLPLILKSSLHDIMSLVTLFVIIIFSLYIYSSEARKYQRLNSLYKNTTIKFSTARPNKYWFYLSVIIYAIDLFLLVFLVQNQFW